MAYALLWPTHGPARMAAHLRQPRWGGWQVSASGVHAILCRHGLRTRWERLTKLEAHSASTVGLLTERTRTYLRPPPVEAQRPGDLVCLDAFYVGKLTGVGKVWQLTACDAACSYALATVVPRVTAQAAVHFLRTHVVPIYQRAGHRIRIVLTDGGPEFQTAFTAACQARGIEHRRTKPRHAWTNGFVEPLAGHPPQRAVAGGLPAHRRYQPGTVGAGPAGVPALPQPGATPSGLSPQGSDPGHGIQDSVGVSKCKHLVRT